MCMTLKLEDVCMLYLPQHTFMEMMVLGLDIDDHFLAVGSTKYYTSSAARHTVYIYDLRDGQIVCTIESPNSSVNNPGGVL